jgi:hypothetical protein
VTLHFIPYPLPKVFPFSPKVSQMGNFYQKLKFQTIEVLHHFFFKKTPPTLLGRGESSKKK